MNAGFDSALKRLFAAAALLAVAACAPSPSAVSYSKDVQPILAKNCSECHAAGQKGLVASGLDTTSYQNLMKGGKFGPLVKPGDALTSALNMLVEGRVHASIQMPHGREKLPAKDVETLKAWVNEGAKNN
jgi:mono/diheme cytochrome c family protein